MAETAAHVALAALTALSWFGAGSLVLAPFGSTGERPLDALNRLGVGAVAFSLLTFAAGWVGLLYAVVYVPLFVVTIGVGVIAIRRLFSGVTRPRLLSWTGWPRWEVALALLIALHVAAALVITAAPISSADALFYHAALPEVFERTHHIREVPWTWGSYQPFAVQMLVLDGLLLWDSVQGAFAPLLLGLGAAAAVFWIGHRLGGRSVGLLATSIFFAQPFALWLATSTFVEPGGAFAVALAVANLMRFREDRRTPTLALAGVFTGAIAGTKYIGAAAAAVLAVTALVALRRKLDLRLGGVFAVAAALVALPWYVKNAILVGDPVYPLLGWPNDEARRAAADTFANFGYGRSPSDLALLPLRLLSDAGPFNRAEYITPLFLLFAPVSLLARPTRRVVSVLLAAAAAYVLVWFLSVQDARYLFFAMPVLAVAAALGIIALARGGQTGRIVAATVASGAFAVSALVSGVYASQFAAVTLGGESDDVFLTSTVSYHEATIWLNRRLPPDARVALGDIFVLHVDRPALAWTSDALPTTAGPAATRAFFRREGITHALVFARDAARRRQLRSVGATRIGRVHVHAVTSRTLSRLGPEEMMEVYSLSER